MRLTRIRPAIILSLIASASIARLSSAQTLVWHQTNGPYGGNISALAANSSTIFAGLKYGGLYRSTNQGDFWMRADSGIPRIPIYALAANGPLVFAGTDSGVYRSTDDGISWVLMSKMDTTYQGCQISALASSGRFLFAATYLNKIFRSTDSGGTWTSGFDLNDTELLGNPGIVRLQIVGSIILAGTFEDNFATDQTQGCIWRSIDSGNTWSRSTNGIFHPFETTDFAWTGTYLYASCLSSGLYQSFDTGTSWNVVDTTGYFYPNNIAALGSVLLAVVRDHHSLMRSNDGGQSWMGVNGLESLQVWELGIQDSTIFAGTDGGVFRSNDSGATWVEVDSGIVASDVDAFAVDSSGVYAGAYGGGVYRFNNMTEKWIRIGRPLQNAYVLSVAKLGQEVFAGTDLGGFSTGGLFENDLIAPTWDSVSSLSPCNSSVGYNIVFSLAVDSQTMFAGNLCGVERSIDSGKTWELVDSVGDVNSLAAQGPVILAGEINGIQISLDGGNTWSNFPILGYEIETGAVAISQQTFFGAFGAIYRSTDDGVSWPIVDSGLVGGAYVLASNGTTIFAGGRFGVFLSTDNGDYWIQENTGLNNSQIYALAIKGDTLFAGTKTGGVYWTDISSLPSSVTTPAAAANSIQLSVTPNPVASEATVRFTITEPEPVSISVFDALGRRVWSEHRNLPAGMQDVAFDARSLLAGAYFYQIRAGNETKSGVMIVER